MLVKANFRKIAFFVDVVLLVIIAVYFFRQGEVRDPSVLAAGISEKCAQNQGISGCYGKELSKIVNDRGILLGQDTLLALQDFDPAVRYCHLLSHEMAKTAVRKEPSEWLELLGEVDGNACASGFFHGIIEAHVGYEPDFQVDADLINDLCPNWHKTYKERTCSHILGHLILLNFEGKMEPALETCGQVNEDFSQDCFTGVFMEDSFKTMLTEHGFSELPVRNYERMVKQKERCLKFAGKAGVACWTDLAEIFDEFYNNDPQRVYESCISAPQKDERLQCYMKGVILMAVSDNFGSRESLVSACSHFDDNDSLHEGCTKTLLSSLMHYSVKFTDRAITYCGNIEDKFKESCFGEFGVLLKEVAGMGNNLEKYCAGVPEQYRKICASGQSIT